MAPLSSARKLTIVKASANSGYVPVQKLQKETYASRVADIANIAVRWRGRHVRRHSVG
jgi:hypothetical protein